MNNILYSGDVPNIYQADELDQVYSAIQRAVAELGLPSTKAKLFSAYVKVSRSNLHTVVAMR
jgi:dynein heavy chain